MTDMTDPAALPGLLPDAEIARLCREEGMIDPFVPELRRDHGPSYGLDSFGYSIRLADEFLVCEAGDHAPVLDPTRDTGAAFTPITGPHLVLPPHGFALARSVERFRMPADVLGLAVGKSTYARLGVHVLLTPLEPGWEGVLTIEIANLTPLPAVLHAGAGIAQILFVRGTARPRVSYADRGGPYQGQTGITLARATPSIPAPRRAYEPDPDD